MRLLVLTFFISVATISLSQTRNIRVDVNYTVSPESIFITLNSQAEDLTHTSIQILDSLKKVVKTMDFPKPVKKPGIKQWTEISIQMADLLPGNYTWVAYLGKEEMYRRGFSKAKK